jgi:outer membrane protein assembly factor BamB
MNSKWLKFAPWLPAVAAVMALAALSIWWTGGVDSGVVKRIPGTDAPPGVDATALVNPAQTGKVTPGAGQAATNLPGAWAQFRGPTRGGANSDPAPLARSWPAGGPPKLWSATVGEGYAGPAIEAGRVFLMDYDREAKQSVLRCLSLADGAEIWRYAYPLTIKRNHGMTRTTPALAGGRVVAVDSKCNVLCCDAATGQFHWAINLVREFGTKIPEWYAGQCPLIIGNTVILAPSGPDALLLAVDLEAGRPLWQTPNARDWKMTHSSVMPMKFGGHDAYLYCGSGGVAGMSATNGALLWDTTDWKISIACVPSPVVLPGGRIFLSGGYNAGSLMLQVSEDGGKLAAKTLFRLPAEKFGATQQTPILRGEHLYGVRPDGQFVCLDFQGKVVWASGPSQTYGLGSYLMAGDLIFAVNDTAKLSLLEASPARFNLLAQTQVVPEARESWGPMALAGNRLLVRDFTHLVCLDVGAK